MFVLHLALNIIFMIILIFCISFLVSFDITTEYPQAILFVRGMLVIILFAIMFVVTENIQGLINN